MLSTAALDKHPQSSERGITLDLGFSAFQVTVPDRARSAGIDFEQLQVSSRKANGACCLSGLLRDPPPLRDGCGVSCVPSILWWTARATPRSSRR